MGFLFCDLHVSLNNPSSGDINSSNLSCLSYAIRAKNGPTAGGHIGLYGESMKISSSLKPKGKEPLASPSGPLPSVFKLCPLVQIWPHMFYIGLYRENMEKSCLIGPAYLV